MSHAKTIKRIAGRLKHEHRTGKLLSIDEDERPDWLQFQVEQILNKLNINAVTFSKNEDRDTLAAIFAELVLMLFQDRHRKRRLSFLAKGNGILLCSLSQEQRKAGAA